MILNPLLFNRYHLAIGRLLLPTSNTSILSPNHSYYVRCAPVGRSLPRRVCTCHGKSVFQKA